MDTTYHGVLVTINRKDGQEIDGGIVKFYGEDYDAFTEADAIRALMPNGSHDEKLNLDNNMLLFRGIMLPISDFGQLTVQIVEKSRPG